jgi:predicted aspartyl protease
MNPRACIGTHYGLRGLLTALVLVLTQVDMRIAWATPPDSLLGGEPASASPTAGAPDEGTARPDYNAATRPDQIGRIVVPVMVNDRGPFSFVLDTGANRTVLTPKLAAALGLAVTADGTTTMNGVTGSAVVPTAEVARVAAGDIVLTAQQLPVADALARDIDGVLGVDALVGKRVTVDFRSGRIEIRNARRQRPLDHAKTLPAQSRFGGLLVIDAFVDHIRVKAVIDTGSEYTLGNDALLAALYRPARVRQSNAGIDVVGETLARQHGERQPVMAIKVGDVLAMHFDIVFGKFYIFKLWDLDTRPALVIGMDLIGKLDALAIDYEQREVQLLARQERSPFLRR